MRKILAGLAMALLATVNVQAAGELDNEKAITNEQIQLAQDLPATLVVRVKAGTEQVEVLHSSAVLGTDAATRANVTSADFMKVDASGKTAGELDSDSSKSSWYFCFPNNNWYTPSYNYYGYNYGYTSYYQYNWGGYHYYYYSWSYYAGYGYGHGW